MNLHILEENVKILISRQETTESTGILTGDLSKLNEFIDVFSFPRLAIDFQPGSYFSLAQL